MLKHTTTSGDCVYQARKHVIMSFAGKRKVLSSSVFNGGLRTDIRAVFNKDENPDDGGMITMRADSYEEHLRLIAEEMDLDTATTTGLSTVVKMKHMVIETEKYHHVTVTALVTAGVEVNGGKAGDPASFDELVHYEAQKPGTINIILHLDCNLPDGAMTRAVITATEAKTACLNELMIDSRYSMGLATGSGTDGVIIIANPHSETTLTNIGQHSILGEIVGRVVKRAVGKSLALETGVSADMQASVFRRGRRFGITIDALKDRVEMKLTAWDFEKHASLVDRHPSLVSIAVAYYRLMDESQYKLQPQDILVKSAIKLLALILREKLVPNNKLENQEILKDMFLRMLETVMINPEILDDI